MKILFLGFSKLKYMPYANFYLDNIDLEKNEIHFVYWNRDLKEEDLTRYRNVSFYEFKYFQNDDVTKLSKVKGFFKYRHFSTKIIRNNDYDLIIALHTFPAVLLRKILNGKYRGKFVFDYRDSTYEKYGFFKKIIGKLVKSSKLTFVSSDAFRSVLPLECKHKIVTTHNISIDTLYQLQCTRNEQKCGIIRIAFWGFIRDKKLNESLIQKISKDQRFELHFYGREQQVAVSLKEYAKLINAKNVYFHGEYVPEDRYKFAQQTDIIHNMFDDDNMMIAMSNKYYDCIAFKIPQLCYQGSFMARRAKENGVGFECDPYASDFTTKIYEYYSTIDRREFEKSCCDELKFIKDEYRESVKQVLNLTQE